MKTKIIILSSILVLAAVLIAKPSLFAFADDANDKLIADLFTPQMPSLEANIIGTSQDDVSVALKWDLDEPLYGYGFKVEKGDGDETVKETAAIYNPPDDCADIVVPEGTNPDDYTPLQECYQKSIDENPDEVELTSGGYYTDSAVTIGETYTYYVTTFDTDGNESKPAIIHVKVEVPLQNDSTEECLIKINKVSNSSNAFTTLTWLNACKSSIGLATYMEFKNSKLINTRISDTLETDKTGTKKFKIYNNGKFIGETDETSYTDRIITAGPSSYILKIAQ